MPHDSRSPTTAYTIAFATLICVVCGVLVSSAAVVLKDRQEANNILDRKRNVLLASGLLRSGETLSPQQLDERFAPVVPVVIRLETGEPAPDIDPLTFDQRAATSDPERSEPAPKNAAGVARLPEHALVYEVRDAAGALEMVVLPINGKGLWSTLYGYVALDSDGTTIRGITYYAHGETPGLGGEVDNPRWKALWPGRKAFGEAGNVEIEVIKGTAGPPSEDPHRVDGLSGATITSRGVSSMLRFWLSEEGFGPYLERLHEGAVGQPGRVA
jgi:Na+-transporting NADH:ubiquinone oxidoreductase subunit C